VVSPSVTTNYSVVRINTISTCGSATVLTQNVSLCTGIESTAYQNEFKLFPNPTSGNFIISYIENAEVFIYDSNGKLVLSSKLNEKNLYSINCDNFASGIYLIKLISNKTQVSNKIIVVR
jgi:hypothetical protein